MISIASKSPYSPPVLNLVVLLELEVLLCGCTHHECSDRTQRDCSEASDSIHGGGGGQERSKGGDLHLDRLYDGRHDVSRGSAMDSD